MWANFHKEEERKEENENMHRKQMETESDNAKRKGQDGHA
jgi:hypothetical protein